MLILAYMNPFSPLSIPFDMSYAKYEPMLTGSDSRAEIVTDPACRGSTITVST